MTKLQIVIDCDYLCHRAFHSTGHLSGPNEARTGVIYGFLTTIKQLKEEFGKCRFIFCFDSRESKRKELYPAYKANRVKNYDAMTEMEQFEIKQYHRQVKLLRTDVLPSIGFKNIRVQPGYEADDHVAQAVYNAYGRRSIIVSADHDMFQLIGTNTSIWDLNKKRLYTIDDFEREYKIKPSQWTQVKAIAGCNSDNVKGVERVGEKTACKWVRGLLQPGSKAYENISKNIGIVAINLPLVELPFEGTEVVASKKDEVTKDTWYNTLNSLGMISIRESRLLSDRHRERMARGKSKRE